MFFGYFHNKVFLCLWKEEDDEDVELMRISVKIRKKKEMRFSWKEITERKFYFILFYLHLLLQHFEHDDKIMTMKAKFDFIKSSFFVTVT